MLSLLFKGIAKVAAWEGNKLFVISILVDCKPKLFSLLVYIVAKDVAESKGVASTDDIVFMILVETGTVGLISVYAEPSTIYCYLNQYHWAM